MEIRRQTSYISGRPYRIKDILDNMEWWWDYRKMDRLPLFHTSIDFFNEVHSGKTFTDNELREHPYYQYLLAGENTPARCIFHMRDGIEVYHDIKNCGMRMPLEAWRDEKRKRMIIHRGLRRLAIKNALGHKRVNIRVYKDRTALERFQEDSQERPDDSIHGTAVKQFQKHGCMGTDKFWIHNYTPYYDLFLSGKRNKYKKVLDIGVFHGGSLLLWHDVFPQAHIYGVDKDITRVRYLKKSKRVTLLQGRQGDDKFFKDEVIPHGKWDLIVDDCSHSPKHQKDTFELLWDSVESGGYYVIEDLYWRGINNQIAMNKLKDMIDHVEVKSVHFYYNIVFVEKR